MVYASGRLVGPWNVRSTKLSNDGSVGSSGAWNVRHDGVLQVEQAALDSGLATHLRQARQRDPMLPRLLVQTGVPGEVERRDVQLRLVLPHLLGEPAVGQEPHRPVVAPVTIRSHDRRAASRQILHDAPVEGFPDAPPARLGPDGDDDEVLVRVEQVRLVTIARDARKPPRVGVLADEPHERALRIAVIIPIAQLTGCLRV